MVACKFGYERGVLGAADLQCGGVRGRGPSREARDAGSVENPVQLVRF